MDNDGHKDNKSEIEKAQLTSAQTDTESGNENLDEAAERKRSIKALKMMHEKGLISDDEFEKRMAELKSTISE